MDRILFVLALIGVLITVHLQLQERIGFSRGCTGFQTSEAFEAQFDCAAVTESGAGTMFGISNSVLGMGFYLFLALVTFILLYAKGPLNAQLRWVRSAAIVVGFAFSVGLFLYQHFVLHQYCLLCIGSATVATLLFITLMFSLFKKDRFQMQTLPLRREAGFLAIFAVLALAIITVDVTYFNKLQAAPAPEIAALPAETATEEPGQCLYDLDYPAITDYQTLVLPTDYVTGNTKSAVTVIEFFEPNCGHCAALHPVMKEVIEENKANARFVIKPVMFWPEVSANQVAAIWAAREQGKFYEMVDRQMMGQQRGGIQLEQLQQIATEIGMNADQMTQKINAGAYNETIATYMDQFRSHSFRSVPLVIINGKVVRSRSKECLNQLIKEAAAPAAR